MNRLEDYLDEHEGPRLEFKGRDSVTDAESIPRAVCGFLNASGGEVIVGIEESMGRHVVNPIVDCRSAQRVVLDRLVSKIEPSLPSDVRVECLESEQGGGGLRILVPGTRHLHAVRKKGGFLVVERVGDRQVPMTWLQISDRIRIVDRARGESIELEIEKKLERWQESLADSPRLRRDGGLYLVLEPGDTSIEANARLVEEWRRWAVSPELIGIRRTGWHFASSPELPRQRDGRLATGDRRTGYRVFEFSRSGEVWFATSLEGDVIRPRQTSGEIYGHGRHQSAGVLRSDRPIHPVPLLETITSCVRFQAKALETMLDGPAKGSSARVSAGVRLTGVRDARMGRAWIDDPNRDPGGSTHDDYYAEPETPPLFAFLRLDELLETPDRLAYALARKLYDEFLVTDEDVPYYSADRGVFDFERAY